MYASLFPRIHIQVMLITPVQKVGPSARFWPSIKRRIFLNNKMTSKICSNGSLSFLNGENRSLSKIVAVVAAVILFPVLVNAQEIQEIAIDPESETADPINASLVWGIDGGSPAQVNIAEGGTYSVPLHISGPAYIQYPDSENVPAVMGNLYHIEPEDGEREFVATISVPHDNPDVEFAWPAAGSYEFD